MDAGSAHLDRDMFSLMWGPTVAAVSVVLDHAEDMGTVRQALDGLLQAAKLGAYHHVDEVRGLLLFTLCNKQHSVHNNCGFAPEAMLSCSGNAAKCPSVYVDFKAATHLEGIKPLALTTSVACGCCCKLGAHNCLSVCDRILKDVW